MFECEVHDWSHLVTSETKLVIDCDGILFKAASTAEIRHIKATNKHTEDEYLCKNISSFWGRSKKTIGVDTELYNINTERISQGLNTYTRDDFIIEEVQEVKMDLEMCKILVYSHLKKLREHTGIKNCIYLAGDEDNFRLKLPTPEQYKGNRVGTARPKLLKDLITWFQKEHVTYKTPVGVEADDFLTMFGFLGYKDYRKTGKFSYVISSNDKDAKITPCLLLDWTKSQGELLYKNMYLIESADKTPGQLTLKGNYVKGVGTKYFAYQMLVGDDADHYGPVKFFKNISYGKKTFFKDFDNLEDSKSVLQKVVDKYRQWFSEGVEYTSWDGKQMSLSWLEYAEILFSCAYMKRTKDDKTKFEDVLKRFGVDYV